MQPFDLICMENVSCERCGTGLASDEWFCTYCGKERPTCPECGANMNSAGCVRCETPRMAPCSNCGLLIQTTKQSCPECGYDASKSSGSIFKSMGKVTSLIFMIGGIVAFLVLTSVIPGPAIIGQLIGGLLALPMIAMSLVGLGLFSYGKKKSEKATAASIKNGRDKNKSKEYLEKEAERKAATADAIANMAGAAQEKIEERQKKKELDEKIEETERLQRKAKKHQIEAQNEKERIQEQEVEVPSVCPFCGVKWRGKMIGSNYERLRPNTFQCTECGHTRDYN